MKKVWTLAAALRYRAGTVQAEEEIQAKSLAELLQSRMERLSINA